MNTGDDDAFAYCADLVRRMDEDLWLSAQYAPKPARRRLLALYALHLEVRRIPAAVSEPPLGEIRLQWWREALDEIEKGGAVRAHPAAIAAKAAEIISPESKSGFGAAIDARARLLYGEPFSGVDDFTGWLGVAESFVAPLAGGFLAPLTRESCDALAAGTTASGLARFGRVLAPELAERIQEKASELLASARPLLRGLPDAAIPAALPIALAPLYLRKAGGPSATAKRWRLFTAAATGRLAPQR